MVRDATGERWGDDLPLERTVALMRLIVEDIRREGRTRVTLWARSKAAADLFQVRRVLWAGNTTGPGHGAYKAGTYHIDQLADILEFHIGMTA